MRVEILADANLRGIAKRAWFKLEELDSAAGLSAGSGAEKLPTDDYRDLSDEYTEIFFDFTSAVRAELSSELN